MQELSPTTELLLYFASRAQNVDEWILPALARGEIVLSDRFTDSSLVYQGCGRGLGAETVMALDRIACRGLKPDLTLLVDVDAEASLARARARNAAEPHCETRMDDQSLEFHRKAYDAYHALAAAEPERVKVIDGRTGIDEIEREIWKVVSALCLRISGATRTSPRRSNRCWRRTGWRRRCCSPGRRAWARPRWPAAWARACWATRSRSSSDDLSLEAQPRDRRGPRKMAGREAQRRSAVLRHPSRFRHLRARTARCARSPSRRRACSRSARPTCRTTAAAASS